MIPNPLGFSQKDQRTSAVTKSGTGTRVLGREDSERGGPGTPVHETRGRGTRGRFEVGDAMAW